MGDLVVWTSQNPAEMSRTMPMTRSEIVAGLLPMHHLPKTIQK